VNTLTQNQLILAALLDGDELTPLDALNRFKCFRLAARVSDLRREGWPIETRTGTENGKRFAVYYIAWPANLPRPRVVPWHSNSEIAGVRP
jgi:hypothetical protein